MIPNRPLLSQLITQEGHIVVDGGIVKDDRDSLAKAYASLAKDCDMVISSGGASQGQEDHAKNALSNIGAVELFWRVAMKPGRPVGAAHIGNVPLFFLPGNPVAVYVCTNYLFYQHLQSCIILNLQRSIQCSWLQGLRLKRNRKNAQSLFV